VAYSGRQNENGADAHRGVRFRHYDAGGKMVAAGGAYRSISGKGIGSGDHRMGCSSARRLTWGVDTLDGLEASRAGLADRVADDPHSEAKALAIRLAELPAGPAAAVPNARLKSMHL